METIIRFGLIAAAGLLVFLVIRIFSTPLRWAFKLLINALSGFVGLFVLNYLGGFIGIELGVNWINAIAVGALGVPGVVLLLLLKYFF